MFSKKMITTELRLFESYAEKESNVAENLSMNKYSNFLYFILLQV